jgi:hypothetical protein
MDEKEHPVGAELADASRLRKPRAESVLTPGPPAGHLPAETAP